MTNLLNNLIVNCDAPRPWGVYFKDSDSHQMEALVDLHDNIMFYLVIILFGVAWIMISIIRNYVNDKSSITNKYLNHITLIELIWTMIPALILGLVALPSFKLLYLMDEVTDPSLTVFVEGYQWYWCHQYPDFLNDNDEELEFDSYLGPELNLFMDNSTDSPSNQEGERDNGSQYSGQDDDSYSESVSREYPLNIPEVSDSAIIPTDVITPSREDEDPHLTLLRNEVRVAYNTTCTYGNLYRETGVQVYSDLEDQSEVEFNGCQNTLKQYLNEKYNGNFHVDDNSN